MKRRNVISNWKVSNLIFMIFLFLIFILYIQLCRVSIFAEVNNINMEEFAKKRNTVQRKLPAMRGKFYDIDGNILALNVPSYTVIAYLDEQRTNIPDVPYHVVDKEKTASLLAPLLDMEEDYLLELLAKDLYQVELGPGGRNISELKKDEIATLELPGIDFLEQHKRFYPNGDFASLVLGYAKTTEKVEETEEGSKISYNIKGELGIESSYNEMLRGIDGKLIFQRDCHGYKIPDTKEERIDAINGNDIYLTLDSTIQRFIEAETKDLMDSYNPVWFQLSVMDAKNGQILGTTSAPSFNPNIRDISNYENYLVSHAFEPGSTMKIFTYMCAIDKGTYKGDETFKSGKIKIGNNQINDWNNSGWGEITYDKGFEYSSNVGITNLIKNFLSKEDLHDCFYKYGFGKKTGIELPREETGKIKFNYEIEVATAGFGQGINTTAIQHLQALSMIANDGTMLKPHIIDKIINPNTNEIVYKSEVEKVEKVVSNKTINKIKELMYNVVNNDDDIRTGKPYYIKDFDILGKTGTSQIFKGGQYLTGDNNHIYSFSALYPSTEPEIIIYASMQQPKNGHGTTILSNTMKSLMTNIAKYRNMFNFEKENNIINVYELPSYINKEVALITEELKDKEITPVMIGDGERVIEQYPSLGTKILSYEKIFLKTNSNNIIIPNLEGWSRNEALRYCDLAKINCDFDGFGYVSKQNIEADILKLTLEQKFKQIDLDEDDDEQ